MKTSIFEQSSVFEKLRDVEEVCHQALLGTNWDVPLRPARDVEVRDRHQLGVRDGLSRAEGQGRLLHDLGNIELQAMELGLRTLVEYPQAPREFREELAAITLSEARHLKACLESLESLGFQWGEWPVHLALWETADPRDSLVERVMIVHRYLEGSGLDAGEALCRKLNGVTGSKVVAQTVKMIVDEEVDHVLFGSRWFHRLCRLEGVDSEQIFRAQVSRLHKSLPRRAPLARELRERAGFDAGEIEFLEKVRVGTSAPS